VGVLGYSQAELHEIQSKWKLRFPPDLVELMRKQRPILGSRGFDWLTATDVEIQRKLDRPYEGFLFDVRKNDLWWPEWGEKPQSDAAQAARLMEVFAEAPKLIPLNANRYLPESPMERGNPVFSVQQSDVIYYGSNLSDWLTREARQFGDWTGLPAITAKEIPFWSEVVRRNE